MKVYVILRTEKLRKTTHIYGVRESRRDALSEVKELNERERQNNLIERASFSFEEWEVK